jgi:ABC-type Zn uptake system ZnuABC Zn-binding protein ZnuA
MNTINKIIALLFLALLTNTMSAQAKLKIVATASMIADMASNIAGDKMEIDCIVPIGGDPHLHESTPRDAILVSKADLVLMNGLTFEGWLSELIDNSGTKAETVLVTKGIKAVESLTYENSADPHAWMDVSNGLIYIKNIKDAFIKIDPENKSTYAANYEVYKKKLEELDEFIMELIKTIPQERRILITSHDAFQYYGRHYGIQLEAILGTSTDADVQTSDIMRINKVIKEHKVPAVFVESTINPKLLQQLAKDNNIVVGGQLYADSIGDEDSPAPSYYDMLKYNTITIVGALNSNVVVSSENMETTQENRSNKDFVLFVAIGVLFLGGFIIVYKKLNQ